MDPAAKRRDLRVVKKLQTKSKLRQKNGKQKQIGNEKQNGNENPRWRRKIKMATENKMAEKYILCGLDGVVCACTQEGGRVLHAELFGPVHAAGT